MPLIFTGNHSNKIKKQLTKILTVTYPQLNIRIYFKLRNKVRYFFRLKDKIPTNPRFNQIYFWKCRGCDATYVGRTSWSAWTRWFGHLGKSSRTGQFLQTPSYSAIREHRETKNHPLSINDFSILATCQTAGELEALESMYTHKLKPRLVKHRPSSLLLCYF